MGIATVNTGMMLCTFGLAPVPLTVLPLKMIMIGGMPAANIMDNAPMLNILPFGGCTMPAPPIPPIKPCIPSIPAPWMPGSPKVMLKNMPALDSNSKAICAKGGVISILMPGQVKVMLK